MTLDELNYRFPNGFHDAEVYSIELNYRDGAAKLHLSLWVGSMDDPQPERESYQEATVIVTGLYFCSIDPPDPTYPFIPHGKYIDVSGDPANVDRLPSLPDLLSKLPADAWCYRFFVTDWNRFIHIAGRNAEITLIGEKYIHPECK
jgi:hypothetical protein